MRLLIIKLLIASSAFRGGAGRDVEEGGVRGAIEANSGHAEERGEESEVSC